MNRLLRAIVTVGASLLVTPAATIAFAQGSAPEVVAPASRNVTPSGVTPGPTVDGPLVREPTPPPPPEPPRWRKFFLPKTSNASTLHVDQERTIRISGVTAPAAEAMCQRIDGSEWPCGRAALYAFRMFIGGRAVECYFPPVEGAVEIVAPCRIGRTDLGMWLSEQGWVTPNDLATDAYRKAAEEARCAHRGLWRWTEHAGTTCARPAQGLHTPVHSSKVPLEFSQKR
jgi:endonuclease YncB( thermonuclease family)